jgi:hypothetical protein
LFPLTFIYKKKHHFSIKENEKEKKKRKQTNFINDTVTRTTCIGNLLMNDVSSKFIKGRSIDIGVELLKIKIKEDLSKHKKKTKDPSPDESQREKKKIHQKTLLWLLCELQLLPW